MSDQTEHYEGHIRRLAAERDQLKNALMEERSYFKDFIKERDRLRAGLAAIANDLIDSELASSEKRWVARHALAEGTKE